MPKSTNRLVQFSYKLCMVLAIIFLEVEMARDEEPTFGRLLKRYRRSARLTQETLAERVGYSPNYISMLERGVRMPAPATVEALAKALDLTSADRTVLDVAAGDQSKEVSVMSPLSVPHGRLI